MDSIIPLNRSPPPQQTMAPLPPLHLCSLLFFFAATFATAQPFSSSSQSYALLRLAAILEHPAPLSTWTHYTPFCSLSPNPSLSLSCSPSGHLTNLSIFGDDPHRLLSHSFSSLSLFTTLSLLPSLTRLSLSSLGLHGPIPATLRRLPSLTSLNLSSNHFNGTVPDLTPMTQLTDLDLSGNLLGPVFPSLPSHLAALTLKNNQFHSGIPTYLSSLQNLDSLDLSFNKFIGRVPPFLFSLSSIKFLDLSHNMLAGALPENLSCRDGLGFVDFSSNLLVGSLPECIRANSSVRVVISAWNCLSVKDHRHQHLSSHCNEGANEGALAAVLPPDTKKTQSNSKLGLLLGIGGGIIVGLVLLGLLFLLILRKGRTDVEEGNASKQHIAEKTPVSVAALRTPTDARHIQHSVRMGALGLIPYRIFTIEELNEATNSFDASNLIGKGREGQFYKGWLQDGSAAVVRCMKLRQKHSPQVLTRYMDAISKLRHCHLVSILGHCIDCGDRDTTNSTNTVYLVFEYVSNGTLRSHLTEWRKREMLKWPQRIAAVIGVAKGVQFLHNVTVPSIVGNNLSIENILLDETLTAKINKYSLPALPKSKNGKIGSENPFEAMEDSDDVGSVRSSEDGEKEDVYQLGLILLEVITGKPAESEPELDELRVQLQTSLNEDPSNLRGMADPTICGTFAYDSLGTAVEITLKCVDKDPKERPSIDDVLWNLQYSVQVQDGWASSENFSSRY